MLIYVKLYKQIFAIEIELYDTIHELRDKIYEIEGTPPEQQGRLKFREQELHPNSFKKLIEYNIESESTIELTYMKCKSQDKQKQLKVQINAGVPIEITFLYQERISDLKYKIFEKEGIKVENIRIFFKGNLLDEGKKAQEYAIKEHDTLQLDMI